MWTIIGKILDLISPELRAAIKKSLDEWELKAKETDSKVDDVVVALVKMLLGFWSKDKKFWYKVSTTNRSNRKLYQEVWQGGV